jgi:hypothetical protein
MPVVSYKKFPLADKEMSWSFTAEDGNRLIERGGWSLFKQAHTWFDDSDGSTPETKSAYKLPHHKEVDGEVKTVWRGCTAAMSRLMQANTQIPESDRRGCYNHLAKHYREFDEEPPEFGRYSNEEIAEWLAEWGYSEEEIGEMFARTFGVPTPTQLEKINALAKRPLAKEEVFVFTSKMVGDALIPERLIQIDKSLLDVFKQDADQGVALMLDHPWAGLFARPKAAYPYGRSFNAVLRKGDIEGENWALYSDKYIVRGRVKDGISTDAIIADIEDGVMFDTSIGWYAENYECSVCGKSIYQCDHMPGRTYDKQLCYIVAKPPGHLMEESLVFDGAYESAGVLSVDGVTKDSGLVVVKDIKSVRPGIQLCHTYNSTHNRLITLARRDEIEPKAFVAVPDLKKGGDADMDAKMYTQEEVDALVKQEVEKALASAQFLTQEKATEVLKKAYSADEVLRLAQEGLQYREELVQDALEWGIRAYGNDFATDAWKQLLSEPGRTIQAIKDFRDQFKAAAEKSIPAGRVTDPESGKDVGFQSVIPDDAFKL